jgi:hypothetical protein
VGRVRRLTIALIGAGALAALLVVVWPSGGAAPPEAVTATLSPRAALFGDPVVARIDAPAEARITTSFRPYRIRSATRSGTTRTYVLECLTAACAPGAAATHTVRFPSAVVAVPGREPVAISWPALRVSSRLAAGDAQHPSFRADLAQPHATSRVDPEAVGWTLTALAGVILLGTTVWLVRAVRPRRRVTAPALSRLEQALELVRQSATASAERRRAALDLLAVELGDDPFAGLARTLAWSAKPPEPPAVNLLADEVKETAE